VALVDIFNAVAADALLAGITSRFGGQSLDLEDSPPRVVWVPKRLDFAGKRVQGTGPSVQSMLTRTQDVEIHIWAKAADGDFSDGGPFAAAELLLDRVLWAIRNATLGNFRVTGGDWTPDSVEQLGRELVINVTFDLPVVLQPSDDASTLATVTQVNPTTNPATSSMSETMAFPRGDLTRTPVL
jgi:hypothetical protein